MTTHQLLGLHHVTAITSNIETNYSFFTDILGMRLVKKSVNQDDIQTYHTYYADDLGSPGTTMTFFDFPNSPFGTKGTNSITRTSFRVPTDQALLYYLERFNTFQVKHSPIQEQFGKKVLHFWDEDNQAYQLISDELNTGMSPGIPWKKGPVPQEFAIYGLGPIEITVSYLENFLGIMTSLFQFKEIAMEDGAYLLEVGEKGNGAQMILKEDTISPSAQQGYGEVHHVAFRVKKKTDLAYWADKIAGLSLPNSGYVNRFYFESLYVRVGHILIELATDEPGFTVDEPYETLGESLALPPFLETKRDYIEQAVRPFNTKRTESFYESYSTYSPYISYCWLSTNKH